MCFSPPPLISSSSFPWRPSSKKAAAESGFASQPQLVIVRQAQHWQQQHWQLKLVIPFSFINLLLLLYYRRVESAHSLLATTIAASFSSNFAAVVVSHFSVHTHYFLHQTDFHWETRGGSSGKFALPCLVININHCRN